MTPEETPFEVGLGRLVQLDRVADCVGRSALARQGATSPARRLVGLTVAGDRLAGNGTPWPLTAAGQPAGTLASLRASAAG